MFLIIKKQIQSSSLWQNGAKVNKLQKSSIFQIEDRLYLCRFKFFYPKIQYFTSISVKTQKQTHIYGCTMHYSSCSVFSSVWCSLGCCNSAPTSIWTRSSPVKCCAQKGEDGRCKVSVTEPIKICSSRAADPQHLPAALQPALHSRLMSGRRRGNTHRSHQCAWLSFYLCSELPGWGSHTFVSGVEHLMVVSGQNLEWSTGGNSLGSNWRFSVLLHRFYTQKINTWEMVLLLFSLDAISPLQVTEWC